MIVAVALAAAQIDASGPEDWRDLQSSERIAAGVDASSIRRSGDEVAAKVLVATRDLDVAAKRFSATYVVASVTVNCRTRSGRMKLGPLQDGDGRILEPAPGTEDVAGPVRTELFPMLCGSLDRTSGPPRSPTINQFLHRVWPPVPGIGRGW